MKRQFCRYRHQRRFWLGPLLALPIILPTSAFADVTIPALKDSYLRESSPSRSYGSASELDMYGNVGSERRPVLQFDLNAIPANTAITSAKLRVRVSNTDDGGPVNVHRVTKGWSESGATWNSMSADMDASTTYGSFVPKAYDTYSIDITALVNTWLCGVQENFGLALVPEPGAGLSKVYSRNYLWSSSRRPRLVVATASAPLDCSDPALFEPPVIVEPKLAPPSLRYVDVPRVNDLGRYVYSESKAIRLGKALFWDMQAGSDGMACASCHFNAGTDSRIKNQLSPGLLAKGTPDTTFQATASGAAGGPNYTVRKSDFPFHQFNDPNDRSSGVKFTTNDAFSAAGVFSGLFNSISGQDSQFDECEQIADPVFNVGGHSTRAVEPRQTPSVINAVFNFRNFWDGRANNVFNGVGPFGKRNGDVKVYDRYGNARTVDLRNSSLASQAVGTIQSPLEMICNGRKLADLGRKLLPRRPLAFQEIHSNDSVLGYYRDRSGRGLSQTYESLIKEAFRSDWWAGSGSYDGYNHMEANFSLFWGLAIQMYQATLISDEAPYDKFAYYQSQEFEPSKGRTGQLSSSAYRGLKVFLGKGKCAECHTGPEFSSAASSLTPGGLVDRMPMGDGQVALYDEGFYNIGVTPTNDDLAVGGKDPFGNPLSFSRQYVSNRFVDPISVDSCTFEVPFDAGNCSSVPGDLSGQRVAVDGAFKTPILRNVELTGPYMHNGSMSTLEQVVEFYNRGGNFRNRELDPAIESLGLSSGEKADLVAFLKSLTDPRVKYEKAPFDHPELVVPNGHIGDESGVISSNGLRADEEFLRIPPVGKYGRSSENLPALIAFEDVLGNGGPKSVDSSGGDTSLTCSGGLILLPLLCSLGL